MQGLETYFFFKLPSFKMAVMLKMLYKTQVVSATKVCMCMFKLEKQWKSCAVE